MSDAGPDAIVATRNGDVQIIEFVARSLLDQVAIEQVGRQIEQLVERSGHPKFIISLSNLQQISSAMLGVVVSVNRKVKGMKGELRLAGVPEPAMAVFKLTKLDRLVKIYPDTLAAMKKF